MFDRTYAKRESNCNTEVIRLTNMWPTYRIYHLFIKLTYQINKFYASYKAVAKKAVLFEY